MIPMISNAPCINMAVTTSASSSVPLPCTGPCVRLINEGPNTCYVSIGIGAQTATLPGTSQARTCTPVLAGTDITLTLQDSVQINQLSAICRTGTATLDIQVDGGV